MESYINKIVINKVRTISDLKIELSKENRQHLIFTGKNGSGKTTVLLEIKKALALLENPGITETYGAMMAFVEEQKERKRNHPEFAHVYNSEISTFEEKIRVLPVHILFSNSENSTKEYIQNGNFILAFFSAKRHSQIYTPNSIRKLDLEKTTINQELSSNHFLQFIVNMKADRSFARDENEITTIKKIDDWFANFEAQLKYIFDVDKLELKFNRHEYTFDIIINDNNQFDFKTLSDGYSAIISIITDLIMKMELFSVKAYDLEGIVIIDEIETHLHVDLQKKILPFLISFFPKLQFIVTTHSPFVLTSLANAVICDLETRIITSDLSKYSYEAIVENYFGVDQYSTEIKSKLELYEKLLKNLFRTSDENSELEDLRKYFLQSQKYYSKELHGKLLELELFDLTKQADK